MIRTFAYINVTLAGVIFCEIGVLMLMMVPK